MATTTTVNGFTIPQLGDPANIETAIHPLANAIDARVNPIFSTVAARDTALPAPTEGQEAYASSVDEKYIYNGSAWVGLAPRLKFKSATTARASNTTLTDDPHMTFPVEANSTYMVKMFLVITGGAGDLKVDIGVPTSAGWYATALLWSRAAASSSRLVAHQVFTTGENWAIGLGGTTWNTQGYIMTIDGAVGVVGNSGNITCRWAQNSSNATATSLLQNSWMSIQKAG